MRKTTPKVYTPELNAKLIEMHKSGTPISEIATTLNLKVEGLKQHFRKLSKLPNSEVKNRKIKPTGSRREVVEGGVKYLLEKTNDGWKKVKRITPYSAQTLKAMERVKQSKVAKEIVSILAEERPVPKLDPMEGKKMVRIDTRTHVKADIDTPDEEVVANYLKRRAESQEGHRR